MKEEIVKSAMIYIGAGVTINLDAVHFGISILVGVVTTIFACMQIYDKWHDIKWKRKVRRENGGGIDEPSNTNAVR